MRRSARAYSADTIEDAARRMCTGIPFPPGLNSASHLNWRKAVDAGIGGTSMSETELGRVLQANAERDWAWYAARYELSEEQAQIVADISQWSGRRPERPGQLRLTDRVLELVRTEQARALTARAYADGHPLKTRW